MVKKLVQYLIFNRSMTPALMLMLIALIAFFGLTTPNFLTLTNFKAIVSNMPVTAIMAVGMAVVLLTGGLDLSVGSILGFTAVNVVLFHNLGWPLPVVILASLSIGAILGSANGLIITKAGINPVITTLGMMAFARGLASWFALDIKSLGTGRVYDDQFLQISRYYITPDNPIVPITLVYIVVLYVVASFVLRNTQFGRNVYAVGSNEYASRLAGINTSRVKFFSYVISGVTASFAAIILVAQLSLGRDDAGLGSELEVITVVVLGGVSMAGGKGGLLGVIIAVLILGVIRNGMVHLETVTGLSYYYREVAKGAILILAISIDAARTIATKNKHRIRQ